MSPKMQYVSYPKSCADIYNKTVCSKINFPFFFSSVWGVALFFLNFLENLKVVLLIRLSYKKRLNFNYNADRSTFLANKTLRFNKCQHFNSFFEEDG